MTPEITPKLIKYFKSNTHINKGGCWIYEKGREKNGYCRVMINYKRYGAHRLSYMFYMGKIPKGKFICHKCDVPACINPNHLFPGSQKENILDCAKKGRLKTKLKPSDIKVIRSICQDFSFRKIGRMFGVHHNTVIDIVKRKWWAHIQ